MMASSSGVGLTYHLTRLSIALKQMGNDIIVLSGPNEQVSGLSMELKKNGIKHFVSKYIDHADFASLFNCGKDISRILKKYDIDIIHANSSTHAFSAYFAVHSSTVINKPAIITSVHSVPRGALKIPKWISMISILNIASSIVLPVSNYTKKQFIKHGLIPQKAVTMYNAIELDVFDEAAKKAELSLDVSVGTVVTYAANLIPIKGHEYFLMAAARVLKKHRAKFLIVGDGPRKKYLQKIAYKLGILNDVLFTGRINWPYIYYLLSNKTDICVSSSLSENFPFYILECMAARKPIVTTNVGGISEAVINGINGYLVPPKDPLSLSEAILQLIKKPEKATEIGLNGRRIVERNFTMKKLTNKLKNVYEYALGSKGI